MSLVKHFQLFRLLFNDGEFFVKSLQHIALHIPASLLLFNLLLVNFPFIFEHVLTGIIMLLF